MPKANALLLCSLSVITVIGVWGIVDIDGLVAWANAIVQQTFFSRGWFVMLAASTMLITCLALAFSPYGQIRLGKDDDRPEFSTASWIAMLFSAGMGVGLLFWAVAEPLTHYNFLQNNVSAPEAAKQAMLATNFHWGLHAWAIYGSTALTIAFFSFRRGTGMMVGAPLVSLFPGEKWARVVSWFSDFMAIIAIAIGVGGSMAMGIFQVADGVSVLAEVQVTNLLIWGILLVMVACYIPALLIDLGQGMARLSNAAMAIAIALVAYTIILGPTEFLLNTVVQSFGDYVANVLPRGFQTFPFYGTKIHQWFSDWTLTYMVWWIAWGPFVGVFVARISKGRTIREFVIGVLFAPTLFSIVWFGAFGGIGLFETINGAGELLQMTQSNVERVTFGLLDRLPFSGLTTFATVIAAFLFIVTSVVSAAFVLGTFSTSGDPNPPPKIRLIWGVLLGLLSVAMILSGSVESVKVLISLGALPFVFISVLLLVCLIRGLREEGMPHADR
jgi:glycine betaine transporter